MEDFYPIRIKRKQIEDVSDDFSDFSLSSPATKIRRLDAELPPIIEEEEHDTSMMFSPSEPLMENGYVEQGGGGRGGSVVIEELESAPVVNEERAIVLFKPMDTSLLQSPSPYSYSVSSDFIAGLKHQVMRSNQSHLLKAADSETEKQDERNGCLAVVPWVPTHTKPAPTQQVDATPQADTSDMMEADETGVASMDVEDENYISIDQRAGSEFGRMSMNEGVNMWPQGGPQHCLIPQLQHNLSTPITWFR